MVQVFDLQQDWEYPEYVSVAHESQTEMFGLLKGKKYTTSPELIYESQVTYLPTKIKAYESTWSLLGISAILVLLSISVVLTHHYFARAIYGMLNYQTIQMSFREKNVMHQQSTLIAKSASMLSISLFINVLYRNYNADFFTISGFQFFALLVFIIALAVLFRFLFFRFIGLYTSPEISRLLNFTADQFLVVLGLFTFVVVLLTKFGPTFFSSIYLVTIGIVLVLYEVLKIIRFAQIFLEKHISFLFLILYLCALEIFPFFMLLKAFK